MGKNRRKEKGKEGRGKGEEQNRGIIRWKKKRSGKKELKKKREGKKGKRLKSGLCRDHARSTEVELKEREKKQKKSMALHRIVPGSTDTKG